MMNLFSKRKPVASTAFSDFIRNAKSEEKKKVYSEVLERATERQNETMAALRASPKA